MAVRVYPPNDLAEWMRWMERRISVQERRQVVPDGTVSALSEPRSITSAQVDDNGDLIISFSDSTVVNAGHVVGPPGPAG